MKFLKSPFVIVSYIFLVSIGISCKKDSPSPSKTFSPSTVPSIAIVPTCPEPNGNNYDATYIIQQKSDSSFEAVATIGSPLYDRLLIDFNVKNAQSGVYSLVYYDSLNYYSKNEIVCGLKLIQFYRYQDSTGSYYVNSYSNNKSIKKGQLKLNVNGTKVTMCISPAYFSSFSKSIYIYSY